MLGAPVNPAAKNNGVFMKKWYLEIITSSKDDSGTDANADFTLRFQTSPPQGSLKYVAGTNYSFGHHMPRGNRKKVEFLQDIPAGFELSGIVIGHDNSGNKPGWQIESINICVLDLPYNDPSQIMFQCSYDEGNGWVASDEPGMIEVTRDSNDVITRVQREFFFKIGATIVADNWWPK
jgi:hypothetical protein